MNPRNFGAEGFLPDYVTQQFNDNKDVNRAQISVGVEQQETTSAINNPHADLAIV